MAKYATIVDGAIYKIRDLTDEQIAAIPAHKASYILPYIEVPRPPHDSVTQHPSIRLDDVILADQVTQAWTVPVDKTQAEMDADEAGLRERVKDELTTNLSYRTIMEMIRDIATGTAPANPNTNAKMLNWIVDTITKVRS